MIRPTDLSVNNFRAINGTTPSGKVKNTCVNCDKQFYTTNPEEDYCNAKRCQQAKREVTGDNSLDFKYEQE